MTDEPGMRVAAAIRESGAKWAMLTSPDSVCYATGHVVPIERGPSPFAGGPSCVIVGTDASLAMVVANVEEAGATASNASVVRSYEGYSSTHRVLAKDNYVRTIFQLILELGVGGTIAVEPRSFPASLREVLKETASRFVDIEPALVRARATKTPAELQMLRRAAEITGVGQQAALERSVAGRRELEIFADIRCAMEIAAGGPMPLISDLLTGVERTAQATGLPPSSRLVQEGDPIICDLAPRVAGYWGDSCNTLFVGEPSGKFIELYEAVRHALEHAAEILRAGITAGEFDLGVRSVVQKAGFEYRHHTGHGIGAAVHEFPPLVPEETAPLKADMVLMVEPGAYVPGVGGVRLEWMFRVTENGSEVMSPYKHVLQGSVYTQ